MDKIICVGKNYLEHSKELGEAQPEKPVLFLKPPSVAVFYSGEELLVKLPKDRGSVHPECEIVVKLDAEFQIEAVTLGLDMTLRDLQTHLKKKGHPWEISKVFEGSAILGPWLRVQKFLNYLEEEFTLTVDGVVRQRGRGREMILSPIGCVEHARSFFPLSEGDLIFTGTPAGVGPVLAGQKVELSWGRRLTYQVEFR